jgi:hypothetical protein
LVASSAAADDAAPQDAGRLPEVVVEGRSDSLVGVADSASQGTVGAEQIEEQRPGSIAELDVRRRVGRAERGVVGESPRDLEPCSASLPIRVRMRSSRRPRGVEGAVMGES